MRRVASLGLALMTGGCATQSVTLLPGENGHPVGAVAVLNDDGSERGVLDAANSRAGLRDSRLKAVTVPDARVERRYGQLLGDLPPPPLHFTLRFDLGRAQPGAAQEETLRQMLQAAAERPGAEIQVVGHTDTLASDAYNDQLSHDRAEEVRDYLISRGVAPDQIRATWRGERELAVPTADGVASEVNRRVEIIVR